MKKIDANIFFVTPYLQSLYEIENKFLPFQFFEKVDFVTPFGKLPLFFIEQIIDYSINDDHCVCYSVDLNLFFYVPKEAYSYLCQSLASDLSTGRVGQFTLSPSAPCGLSQTSAGVN